MTKQLDLSDLQGNIARGYRIPLFRQLFGSMNGDVDRWRDFLGALAKYVTKEDSSHAPGPTLNVGISCAGLQRLVPGSARALGEAFPAFAAGMRKRSAALGDPEDIGWAEWDRRDLWLSIHASTVEELDRHTAMVIGIANEKRLGLDASSVSGAVIERDGKRFEHFGFKDGISNPVFAGAARNKPLEGNGKRDPTTKEWVPIATGEFVLGYPNEQGSEVLAEMPLELRTILHNGTFAVLRVLEQNVQRFREYVREKQSEHPAATLRGSPDLGERMFGRTRDGKALAAAGLGNDFDYVDDPDGTKCPLGAHVRRANPRTSGEHRLLRRSVPFGEFAEPGRDVAPGRRGIYFIAFNASIENQFEFLQRFYINGQADGQRAAGKLVDAKDPIAASECGARKMVIEGDVASRRAPVLLLDIPAFVTSVGGQYYFMPGINGLKALSTRAGGVGLHLAEPASEEGARP